MGERERERDRGPASPTSYTSGPTPSLRPSKKEGIGQSQQGGINRLEAPRGIQEAQGPCTEVKD